MPTIDELSAAVAASDTDELLASQNGIARKLTRAQLLDGMQPALALPSGCVFGRTSPGVGAPEPLIIGANLSLAGSTLSAAAAPFAIPELPAAQSPGEQDLVPLGQGGQNTALAYGQFMAGLSGLAGVDISRLAATAADTTTSRPVSAFLADTVPVEAFGAAGDGVSDDTAAFSAAVASGRPVRLSGRTYVIGGQWTLGSAVVLLGERGRTVLRRGSQSGNGAWISVQGPSFHADGIIFDANASAVPVESWGVLVASSCPAAEFSDCAFINALGAAQGCGLTIAASDPVQAQHVVRNCTATGNELHGIWVQAVNGAAVTQCRAWNNGGYGICVDYTDPLLVQKVRAVQVIGNTCWANQRGISVGNFNATNAAAPVWGNANPDAIGILVSLNVCHDNMVYGIAVAGEGLCVQGNVLRDNSSAANGGAGILANVSGSCITGNMVAGTSQFGIDSGGSIDTEISGNSVTGTVIGLNPGGSQNVRVAGNLVQGCTQWAVTVNNVETDGHGNSFNLAASGIVLADNRIGLTSSSAGGIYLLDAPQGMVVARNQFFGSNGATVGQCLWAHTDGVIIEGNLWNATQRMICNPVAADGLQQVQFPDVANAIMITVAPSGVQSMLSLRQVATQGTIGFVKVTSGGNGYTHATVLIGGNGSGATAQAIISNGNVIGVVVTDPGSGYGTYGATASVSIVGDGSGATAAASVGLPVPEERRLRVATNQPVRFSRVGSLPFQENWTGGDFTAPENAEVEWVGTWGNWRAVQFPPGDYLTFPGDGTLVVSSDNSKDLILKPSGTGTLRLASEAEPAGAVSLLGRGVPLGVVAAPPGSDYRNLDGGAGATFWIKISAQDASGWIAIA